MVIDAIKIIGGLYLAWVFVFLGFNGGLERFFVVMLLIVMVELYRNQKEYKDTNRWF